MTVYKGSAEQTELSQGSNTFAEAYKGGSQVFSKSGEDILPFYGFTNTTAHYLLFGNYDTTGIWALYCVDETVNETCCYKHLVEDQNPTLAFDSTADSYYLTRYYMGYNSQQPNTKVNNQGTQTNLQTKKLYYAYNIYSNVSLYFGNNGGWSSSKRYYTLVMFNNSTINDIYFTNILSTLFPTADLIHPFSVSNNEMIIKDKNDNQYTFLRDTSYDGYFSKTNGFVFNE